MSAEFVLAFQESNTFHHISVPIRSGDTVLVAGPNGVGKSALLAALYRSLPQNVATYLPGHRQINFNNGWETIGQDASQLRQNLFVQTDHFSRYKGAWAEDQFKLTVRTLVHLESAFNRNFRKNGLINSSAAAQDGSLRVSPVDTLNLIFEAARLPVRFDATEIGLSATRKGATYPIDALSDGERAALFIAAAVIVLSPGAVILIDEPEKHLHPSITGLLIEASLRARKDVMVVLASHDVTLIEQLKVTTIIHITDSTVVNPKPEQRTFQANVIWEPSVIPDDLKRDILGARSKILFVEGELSSIDIALYGHIYDDVKISPKGGHHKVSESVKALQLMDSDHWITPYGIIDRDGRSKSEIAKLNKRNIFVLSCPTIENLFFIPEAIACFVSAENEFISGKSLSARTSNLFEVVRNGAIEAKGEIVSKRASWVLERELSAKKLSPKQIKEDSIDLITVSLKEIVSNVEDQFERISCLEDWQSIVFNLPIKNTPIPTLVCEAIGASSFDEYKKVILRQMDIKSDHSKPLLAALKNILPILPEPADQSSA